MWAGGAVQTGELPARLTDQDVQRRQVPHRHLRLGGAGYDDGYGVAVAPDGSVYYTGRFAITADLDPTAGVLNATSAGSDDVFLVRYVPPTAPSATRQ